jgi:hypothetical protein
MTTVIPLRDFSDNEIVLTAFGDWLNDRVTHHIQGQD